MKYIILLFGLLLSLGCTTSQEETSSNQTDHQKDASHFVPADGLEIDYYLFTDGTKLTLAEFQSLALTNGTFMCFPQVDESGKTNTVAVETVVKENPDGTANMTVHFAEPVNFEK